MTREMLVPKRRNVTIEIKFPVGGIEMEFAVTFGMNAAGVCKEAFCLPFKWAPISNRCCIMRLSASRSDCSTA